jgi:hypothetical protein
MNRSIRTILESKRVERRKLTNLPINEKIALLEKLRDRALAIADSPLRRSPGSSARGRQSSAPGRQD